MGPTPQPEPIRYVPVEDRPWRLTMGMRPLDAARWLEVDGQRGPELAHKQQLLTSDHDRVVATRSGRDEASRELLGEIVAYLTCHHPDLIRVRADGTIVETTTGAVIDPDRLHPVDAAGRLVQEDLCVMADTGSGWVLDAASVCFPNRWRLADKIGRDLLAIHGPVAGYEASLDRPMRALFDRLRPERPMWRCNWTLLDAPDLFQPEADTRRRTPLDLSRPGEALWFRVERQTLRRFSARAAITFTIRTYVARLDRLVVEHPEVVAVMRSRLPSIPADSLAYKGWSDLVGPLLDWLATQP
jgi:hypothetical protein